MLLTKSNRFLKKVVALLCCAAWLLSGCVDEKITESSSRQNLLLIVVDDLGAHDLGYTGSDFYETPNIDTLALQGIKFTQAYAAAPICSPTRAALMTGQHPARLHITNWIPGQRPTGKPLNEPEILGRLPLEFTTLSELLRNEGYRTFFAGKWHLGDQGFHPDNQGFDTNIGGGHMGEPPGGYYSPYQNAQLDDGPDGEYLPDRLTSETIRFIRDHRDLPFFAYLSFYTVHTPIQPAARYIDRYRERASMSTSNAQPAEKPELGGLTKLRQDNAAYASMVRAMDDNIGRLLDELKALELDESTIVVFTSDNGGLATLDPAHPIYENGTPTSNAPLRAGKGWLYEGGIRVPLVIRPSDEYENTTISEPVDSMDLFATLLDMVDIDPVATLDGTSLVPVLSGQGHVNERSLYWHFPHYHGSGSVPSSAVRRGPWKLVYFYETDNAELYNLADDPGELDDLAQRYPHRVVELRSDLQTWLLEVGADLPTLNDLTEGGTE